MADTSRRTEAGSAASPWRWEQVPEPQERPVTSRRRASLGRLLGALAFAAFLWILGRRTIAIAIAIGVLVVTIISIMSPAFARMADKVTHSLQHTVARALTFLVLGAFELVVFTPIAFALKLLRRDPLAAGSQPSDLTFWHQNPAVGRPSLHRHQFTYEPRPARAKGFNARLPLASLRAALGLVVVVILFDVVLGAAYNVVFDRGGNAPSGAHIAQLGAWANEPWAAELRKEIASSSSRLIPQPLRGFTYPDYSGRYVQVKNGVRSSYEPSPAGKDPTNVLFFGGSTMFGAYQRDQHTIPSEFARLAEADRRAVRVVNYGVIGYGIWQEVELLEERLTKGDIPDVVIFYDGANEQFIQAREGPVATPSHLYANDVRIGGAPSPKQQTLRGEIYDWWAHRSAAHRFFDGIKSLFTNNNQHPSNPLAESPLAQALWARDQTATRGAERGKDAVTIYQRAVEVVQHLAAAYGFRAEFFWQPLLYTKPVVNGEQDALTEFGATPEAWYASSAEARRLLKPPVIDLSDVLDNVRQPVFVDFDHTNELGAEVIASAIYHDSASSLNTLSAGRQP